MNSLLTVIKAMLEIMSSQQSQISEIQSNMSMDDARDFTDVDFADLTAQIATLSANVTDDTPKPF